MPAEPADPGESRMRENRTSGSPSKAARGRPATPTSICAVPASIRPVGVAPGSGRTRRRTPPPQTAAGAAQPGRVGKVASPEVRRQIRWLATDAETTIQALLGEALNDLFAKHGLAEIADADS